MRARVAVCMALFMALPACKVARPAVSADVRLQRLAQAQEAYALPTFYEESRLFLRDYPGDARAERVRWELAMQLVTENLLSPATEGAVEARRHLVMLARMGSSESLRFDASLVLLKFAPQSERAALADEMRRRFADNPDLVQVDIFAVSSALEELDIVSAGAISKKLLSRFPNVEDAQLYRDVITRAALIGAPLPFDARLQKQFAPQLASRVLLIDFWATWCEPCAAELPRLRAFYERNREAGLELISVSLDERAADAEAVLRAEQLPWPNVWSPRGQGGISDRCGVSDLPAYVIVEGGRVRATELRGDALYTFIDRLLGAESVRDPSAK